MHLIALCATTEVPRDDSGRDVLNGALTTLRVGSVEDESGGVISTNVYAFSQNNEREST